MYLHYDLQVRVVDVPGVSLELCGGTHVSNTSEIRGFKIISEQGIASGTRRIEAVAGDAFIEYAVARDNYMKQLCSSLKVWNTIDDFFLQNLSASLPTPQLFFFSSENDACPLHLIFFFLTCLAFHMAFPLSLVKLQDDLNYSPDIHLIATSLLLS